MIRSMFLSPGVGVERVILFVLFHSAAIEDFDHLSEDNTRSTCCKCRRSLGNNSEEREEEETTSPPNMLLERGKAGTRSNSVLWTRIVQQHQAVATLLR